VALRGCIVGKALIENDHVTLTPEDLTRLFVGNGDGPGFIEQNFSRGVLTSKDADGTKEGYDLEMTKAVAEAVKIPVTASGGAGKLEHLYEAVAIAKASAVLAASIFHFGEISIPEAKNISRKKIPMSKSSLWIRRVGFLRAISKRKNCRGPMSTRWKALGKITWSKRWTSI
jgi:hypothetical protein